MLSLGMLTAALRAHDDGALTAIYDVHRPLLRDAVLADLAEGDGPAVLLCSNYVWSLDHNLDVARAGLALRPELVVVHGGPSTPTYAADVDAFLHEWADIAHVLVHGEGEATLCELMEVLAASGGRLDPGGLAEVAGISFLDGNGAVVRTADRERLADLDALASPYLTGEFDDIPPDAWHFCAPIETNRGCPYGCTFCDWGSATRSRIRKFGLDRVAAEVEWCASRGIYGLQLCDANFGIMSRDVDVARTIAEASARHGAPSLVAFTPAKNTTRHISLILDDLLGAGLELSTAISLQTTDPTTLDLVDRSNISTDAYLALAADLRRRGQRLQGDVLVGMPGQTYEAYRADLQFFIDHDIVPRTWSLRLLPNAPMNDPAYRERHGIEVGNDQLVVATSTMSRRDRDAMMALRRVQIIGWRYGLLRHVLNVVQWDHGVEATRVLEAIVDVTTDDARRYPSIAWVFGYFDLYQVPATGWRRFYDEVVQLLAERFGVEASAAVATAVDLQLAVMPVPGRTLPEAVELRHDYAAYVRDATRPLFETGHAGTPPRPLDAYPPVVLTVTGDPERLCTDGVRLRGDPRSDVIQGDFWIVNWLCYELPTEPPVPSVAPLPFEQVVTLGARMSA